MVIASGCSTAWALQSPVIDSNAHECPFNITHSLSMAFSKWRYSFNAAYSIKMRCIYNNYLIFKLGNDDSSSQKKENPAWNENGDQ